MLKMARKGVTANDSKSLRFDSWERAGSSLELSIVHSYDNLFQFKWINFSISFKYFAIYALLIVSGGRSLAIRKPMAKMWSTNHQILLSFAVTPFLAIFSIFQLIWKIESLNFAYEF